MWFYCSMRYLIRLRAKQPRDSLFAGLLLCPVSFLPGPLLEHTLQVNGGILQHFLLDVGIDVGSSLVFGVADNLRGDQESMQLSQVTTSFFPLVGKLRMACTERCCYSDIFKTVLPFEPPEATFFRASFTSSKLNTPSTEASRRFCPMISEMRSSAVPSSWTKTK